MLNTFDEKSRPFWLTKHLQILESEFCVWFQAEDPLRCINDEFYQKDGTKVDGCTVKQQIYMMLSPFIEMGLAKKTNDLYIVLKMEAYTRNVPLQKDRIHLGNGTFHLDTGEFSDEKEFCLHRLNVDYTPWLGRMKQNSADYKTGLHMKMQSSFIRYSSFSNSLRFSSRCNLSFVGK